MALTPIASATETTNPNRHATAAANTRSDASSSDPLFLAIGALQAAEIVGGWSPGGPSLQAMQLTEEAWEAVLRTRAESLSGMVWKLECAWSFFVDEGRHTVVEELASIMVAAAAGESVATPLTSLIERLGEGFYVELVKSAAADAAHLEATH